MSGDWMVRLAGDDWSLRWLRAWFTQEQSKVSRRDDGSYYLTSPVLNACGTEDEAWKVAQGIVDQMNSTANLLEPGHVPVHIGVLGLVQPDGTLRGTARAAGTAHGVARARFEAEVIRDGEVVEPSSPSLAERIVDLQEREGSDGPVARALEQWNLPEQTPTSLNNILEIIRDDVSGGDPDKGRAWRTMARTTAPSMGVQEAQLDADLKDCRDSLQDRKTVGVLARHASPRSIANPMTLDQARDFVRRLLLARVKSKI